MSESWSGYSSYNNLLRTWFVAFGIGAPATFLINNGLVKYISPTTGDPGIIKLFLWGAAAQILMSFINKVINWCSYYNSTTYKDNPITCGDKLSYKISQAENWFLIDVFFDLITMFCFFQSSL